MKKKLLFVINTLGGAGAETALMSLLRCLDTDKLDISLYVLLSQGEYIDRLPEGITLLNRHYSRLDVWRRRGRLRLFLTLLKRSFIRLSGIRRMPYIIKNLAIMAKKRRIRPDKLLWRIAADGAQRDDTEYDLAVAYLEGGSAYYTADYIKAKKKAAFIHTPYSAAGYTRELDGDCYAAFDRIFAVSPEVKSAFLEVYPEHSAKTVLSGNIIDPDRIKRLSLMPGGFDDDFGGIRLLTVGRLTEEKGIDIAVKAMSIIKQRGISARWYVLGEGDRRKALERQIAALGLKEDFILLGAKENPFPYYRQADIYVHATRFEGKSVALSEAMLLGCAVTASDCGGNRALVKHGENGLLCGLSPEDIAEKIIFLAENPHEAKRLKKAASELQTADMSQAEQLLELLSLG